MPQLNQDEIRTLLDALEVWKDMLPMEGDDAAHMIRGLMSGDRDQIQEAVKKAADESYRKRMSRKETAILLQAKLIQMRDAMDVQVGSEFLRRGGDEPTAEPSAP